MQNKDCEDYGGKYCMCEACQSMTKMLEEMSKISFEELTTEISGGERRENILNQTKKKNK